MDLHGVPPEAGGLFSDLAEKPLVPVEELRGEVIEHVARLRKRMEEHEFLDIGLAESIAERVSLLLDAVTADTPDGHRRLVQAAARYFALEHDADSDTTVAGLDDDAEVFNAVARHLGRTDLVIEIP